MIWRITAFVTFGVIGSTLGWWAQDRETPTRYTHIEVLTPTVQPGGDLRIKYSVQRVRSCRVHLDRVLYDADRVRRDLEDVEYAAAPGILGDSSYVVSLTIPRNFAQGEGRYKVISTYYCNPLHYWFSPIVSADDVVTFTVKGDPTDEANGPIEVIPRR